MAWAYYKNGNYKEALKLTEEYVLDNTFEPEALLHTAAILKANGNQKEAQEIKNQLLGAIYELGPTSEQEIKNI